MNANQILLFALRNVNMAINTDQLLKKMAAFTTYKVTQVVVVRKTGAFSVACAGGVYTAAGKAGNALVAAGQSYANLTGAGKIVDATLAAVNSTDSQTSATVYLSLTTGNSAALTADIFVYGVVFD
jgi:hypothetical protein